MLNTTQFIPKIDSLMRTKIDRKSVMGFAGDVGNATCTMASPVGIVTFPHALRMLKHDEVNDMLRENEIPANVYEVDGLYYELGFSASMRGDYAIRQGAMRFNRNYIGVLYAILAFENVRRMKDKDIKPIIVWANHPPMHKMFRDDIKDAIAGEWRVSNGSDTKQFHFIKVFPYVEPVAGHAYLYLDEQGRASEKSLRTKDLMMLDLGGFSLDATIYRDNKPQLQDGSQSIPFGMSDILRDFESLCRNDEAVPVEIQGKKQSGLKNVFRYIEHSDTLKWREAFASGYYDAGGYGILDCSRQMKEAGENAMKEIMQFIQNRMGGIGSINLLVLSGGGMSRSAMGRFFTSRYTGELDVWFAERDTSRSNMMHLVTALGAAKQMKGAFARDLIKSLE